jgi:hypothetical protein
MTDEQPIGRPPRFGLRSLFLLPLLVSPLFRSSVFVRSELEQSHSFASLFNMFACAALYAAIFTAGWRRGIYGRGKAGPRHVLPAARVGACFGVLFMAQVFVPWQITWVAARAQRFDSIFDYLFSDCRSVLVMLASTGGMFVGLFGIFLGAFGGSVVGFHFEWRYAGKAK